MFLLMSSGAHNVSVSVESIPRSSFQGHRVCEYTTLVGTIEEFFKVAGPIYFLTGCV